MLATLCKRHGFSFDLLRLLSCSSTPSTFYFSTSTACKKKKRRDNLQRFEELPQLERPAGNPLQHAEVVKKGGGHGENRKRLRVAVVGIPNSGKSSLVNSLLSTFVCPYSARDNTTLQNCRAILTKDNVQLEFLDTPGVVTQEMVEKFKLSNEVISGPEKSCGGADVLLVVHDVSNRYVREAIPQSVLRLLCLYHGKLPSILVLNKMDEIPKSRRVFDLIRKLTCNHLDDGQATVKITHADTEGCSVNKYLKRKERALEESPDGIKDYPDILRIARTCTLTEDRCRGLTAGLLGWPGFRDVFSVSALTGEGVDQLREHLVAAAMPGQWGFDPILKTDSDPQTVMLGVVRSRLLANLPKNIPYKLEPIVNMWVFDEEWQQLRISVNIATSHPSEHRTIIGRSGQNIKKICEECEDNLKEFFGHDIHFRINLIPKFTVKLEATPETKNVDLFI